MRNPIPPLGWLLALIALAAPGCISINLFDGGRKPLVESVVHGTTGPKILMLEIEGIISDTAGAGGLISVGPESTVERVVEQLDKAREDDEVQGLLLRINSPGGTVTASDIIYNQILRFKEERGVPVVAQLMSTAASGGYYIAMAADEVIAHPTTVTGSIGVIFFGVNISGLMEKIGVENQTLVTGEYKDAGTALRPMRKQERAQLQSVLDDMHERFVSVVDKGRANLDTERVASLADGRIYSANQAKEAGLVDGIGNLADSIAHTQIRGGLVEARVVTYHRPREWKQNYYNQAPPREITLRVGPRLPAFERPGFMYLWAPGAH